MQSGLITSLEVASVFTGFKFGTHLGCWQTKQTKVHIFYKREKGPYQDGLSLMWPGFVRGYRQLNCQVFWNTFFYFQESIVDEGQFVSLEVNHVNEVIMDAVTSPSEAEGSASNILDVKCPSIEYDIPELSSSSLRERTTNLSEKRILGEEMKSNIGHTGNSGYVSEDGNHLTQDYPQSSPPDGKHFPDDILENTRLLNEETTVQSCEIASGGNSTVNFASVNNVPIDVIASSPQQLLPKDKDWAPVTCGEATRSEFIESSDREQPGANVSFDNPIVIDRNIIQDVEKEHNAEFFMGRALKTPERYMKIRNYILDMWQKTKPNFLFKTVVRSGLRNCGDVNSIGRVHAFLEDIGAINEGCLERPVPRVREQGEVTNVKENFHMESWVNSLRPRKKRQRNMDGDWVDSSKAEGMTIQVTGISGLHFPFAVSMLVLAQKISLSVGEHVSKG